MDELTALTRRDVHLGQGTHVACHGKGRKDRITPLTSNTVAVLRHWLTEQTGEPSAPLFPTRPGHQLSRDAIEHRIAHYSAQAARTCPSLRGKTSPRISESDEIELLRVFKNVAPKFFRT